MMSMSKRGWRSKEPVELNNVGETPRVLLQLVRAHLGVLDYSIEDMSGLIGLQPADFENLYGITGKPRFRLVT